MWGTSLTPSSLSANNADFSEHAAEPSKVQTTPPEEEKPETPIGDTTQREKTAKMEKTRLLSIDSMQYHINIVLPESRDQAVYDAIFKSLKEHLS